MLYYDYFEAPMGDMLLVASNAALCGLHFVGEKYFPAVEKEWIRDRTAKHIAAARTQLEEYFAGERTRFDLVLAHEGTDFQRKVWQALRTIPFGETCNYGQIAARIGIPTASRAVGAANGRNPISIIVPCHRVIGANGDLTGYAGGLHRKQALLAHESAHGAQLGLPSI